MCERSECDRPIGSIALLSDRFVAMGLHYGDVALHDCVQNEEVARLGRHDGPVAALAELDETRLVSLSDDGEMYLWDWRLSRVLGPPRHFRNLVRSLFITPEKLGVLVCASTIIVWDFEISRELRRHELASSQSIRWAHLLDGRRLLLALRPGSGDIDLEPIVVLDLDTGALLFELSFEASPDVVALAPDREDFVVVDGRGRFHRFSIAPGARGTVDWWEGLEEPDEAGTTPVSEIRAAGFDWPEFKAIERAAGLNLERVNLPDILASLRGSKTFYEKKLDEM